MLRKFFIDETGASAAEYALIIAIVGVGVGAAALALGSNVTAAIGGASDEVAKCAQTEPTGGFIDDYTSQDCTGAGAAAPATP